jgi:hypothetical protein
MKKNGCPYTILKYVPTAYFLLPVAKLLPLTNGPPKKDKGWKDEGYYIFSLTLATDGLGSAAIDDKKEALKGWNWTCV